MKNVYFTDKITTSKLLSFGIYISKRILIYDSFQKRASKKIVLLKNKLYKVSFKELKSFILSKRIMREDLITTYRYPHMEKMLDNGRPLTLLTRA